MARKITDKVNVEGPSSAYPYGNIKNDTGSLDGTPVDKVSYSDIHQFFAKMADEGGISLNGLADNYTNGFQFFEALQAVALNLVQVNSAVGLLDADISLSTTGATLNTAQTNLVYFKRGNEATIIGQLFFSTDGTFFPSSSIHFDIDNATYFSTIPMDPANSVTCASASIVEYPLVGVNYKYGRLRVTSDLDIEVFSNTGTFDINRSYIIDVNITLWTS